ncbi:unnamed protein product [Alopecurus aequalis]
MAARVHAHHHRVASLASSARTDMERRLRRSPPLLDARQRRPGCGEVAAGTAAGCAAVFCCFPFALLELAVLAPVALCRRTIRNQRNRRRAARARRVREMEELILAAADASPGSFAAAQAMHAGLVADEEQGWCHWLSKPAAAAAVAAEEVAEAEKEVWARFYSTGFWRSPSQREEIPR